MYFPGNMYILNQKYIFLCSSDSTSFRFVFQFAFHMISFANVNPSNIFSCLQLVKMRHVTEQGYDTNNRFETS